MHDLQFVLKYSFDDQLYLSEDFNKFKTHDI